MKFGSQLGGALNELVTIVHPDTPRRVHPELGDIIMTALARDPAERFPDADSLRRAVAAFLDHRDSRARSDEADERLRELESEIASVEGTTHADAEHRINAAFGECRFGFRGALSIWPGMLVQFVGGLIGAALVLAGYSVYG